MQWVSTFRLPRRCLFQVTCCAQTETWACAAPDKVSIRIMHQPQCVTHLCRVDSRSRNISTPQQTHPRSHNYSWFYSQASQKWHAEEWGSLNTHTRLIVWSAMQLLLLDWIITSCVECKLIYSICAHVCTSLSAARLQLCVHTAEVLIQKQCHEQVRNKDLRNMWPLLEAPERPCTRVYVCV